MKIVQLIFALLLLNSALAAQDPNFHIYLCFGQSNMYGIGTIESQDLNVDERFKVFQSIDCSNLGRVKETWYTAVPPNCQCYSRLSPADYFGRTMVENLHDSISIGIINVAVSGCDIRLFDKDVYQDYDATINESWFFDQVGAYDGNPYQYLIDLAQLAQLDGVIKGVLLHHGEANTGNTAWPSYVQKIYNDLLNDLSLNATDVPILAGEVLSAPGNCCESMNPIINQLPNAIPTAHVISSAGCGASDNAHFDSEGYRLLGERYAEKMLSIGYANTAPEVRTMLHGPFDPNTGLMHDSLRQQGLIPLQEPYTAMGYPHIGGGNENITIAVLQITGNKAVVDWVVLELRDEDAPANIVATRACLLLRDGSIVDVDGVSPPTFGVAPGMYYLAVHHRNHLGVMTAGPINLENNSKMTDLSDAATPKYGASAMNNINGIEVQWCGDVTGNGEVKYTGNNNDRDQMLQEIGGSVPTATSSGYMPTDVNLDGTTKYTGNLNDRDPILITVSGSVPTATRIEQMP